MGWEAIEQYLSEVEQEALTSKDQQVPTENEAMLTSETDQTSNFYTDDVTFSNLTPVQPVDVTEQVPLKDFEGTNDYYDLDQEMWPPRDVSVYRNELNSKTRAITCSYANTPSEMQRVKLEPSNDFSAPCSQQQKCAGSDYCQPLEPDEQFWTMKTKLINECAQDVEDTCRCLGISADPNHWSPDQVQQWTVWQCRQFNVPEPNMDYFKISGSELCSLGEADLKFYAPEGRTASVLFSRLEIWRSVVEQTTHNMYSGYPPQITRIPVPRSPSIPSSPDSLNSSTCSSFGDTESQPMSPNSAHHAVDDKDRLPEEPVHHHRQTIQLWQFLKLLLLDGGYTDCIRWIDESRGIFKIENSARVARLWGRRKNRPAMNYDKLSRSIRQYYKKKIMKKTEHSKRLVYQFCKM